MGPVVRAEKVVLAEPAEVSSASESSGLSPIVNPRGQLSPGVVDWRAPSGIRVPMESLKRPALLFRAKARAVSDPSPPEFQKIWIYYGVFEPRMKFLIVWHIRTGTCCPFEDEIP